MFLVPSDVVVQPCIVFYDIIVVAPPLAIRRKRGMKEIKDKREGEGDQTSRHC
jgi:hypothetical protein